MCLVSTVFRCVLLHCHIFASALAVQILLQGMNRFPGVSLVKEHEQNEIRLASVMSHSDHVICQVSKKIF